MDSGYLSGVVTKAKAMQRLVAGVNKYCFRVLCQYSSRLQVARSIYMYLRTRSEKSKDASAVASVSLLSSSCNSSTPRPSQVYPAGSAAILTRCTCLPPRQHCAEVALGASTTDSAAMLTQRETSTPRPSPRCTCLPPRQHCVEVALGGKQVHLGFASEYLLSSSCNFNSSPPRPSPSSPRLRLGELGLGLGGLERSQWVGTSCNFSSSPPRQVQVHLGCASVNLALTRGT